MVLAANGKMIVQIHNRLYRVRKSVFDSELMRTTLEFLGAKTIHCLGDSHVNGFGYISREYIWLRSIFRVLKVDGATAYGLANPNSQTNALMIFREYQRSVRSEDDILFCLGEVDCGFLMWYRATKYQTSVIEQFNLSIMNYLNFLDDISEGRRGNILVYSVPLPTIKDGQDWGEVANKRREVQASMKDRTDITLSYNAKLREHCKSSGYLFLDIQRYILDSNTGLIRESFINKNPLDHHISLEEVGPLLRAELKKVGYS